MAEGTYVRTTWYSTYEYLPLPECSLNPVRTRTYRYCTKRAIQKDRTGTYVQAAAGSEQRDALGFANAELLSAALLRRQQQTMKKERIQWHFEAAFVPYNH
jgi:hypothetical protein